MYRPACPGSPNSADGGPPAAMTMENRPVEAAAERPAAFADVFAAEYPDLRERCPALRGPNPNPPPPPPSVENGLVGVALSGGGNRSSTFCLGVLQALNVR